MYFNGLLKTPFEIHQISKVYFGLKMKHLKNIYSWTLTLNTRRLISLNQKNQMCFRHLRMSHICQIQNKLEKCIIIESQCAAFGPL